MTAFYNEIDPFAAAWLRELIADNLIAPGIVNETSILDLKPEDLEGFDQHHFFAGIGGWSLALRLAGVPDDEPIWTASLPCQPFAAPGKRKGVRDRRDLWPAFRDRVAECRPPTLIGEQVASADGRLWLARVRTDLEALGYAVGASDLCSAGVGAPNIRQRIWWTAHAKTSIGRWAIRENNPRRRNPEIGRCGPIGRLALSDGREPGDGDLQRGGEHGLQPKDLGVDRVEHPESDRWVERRPEPSGRAAPRGRSIGGVADVDSQRCQERPEQDGEPIQSGEQTPRRDDALRCGFADPAQPSPAQPSPATPPRRLGNADGPRPQRRSFVAREHGNQRTPWATSDLVECTDGKARRVEPGVEPLVTRLPGSVVRGRDSGVPIYPSKSAEARICRLRGYGNAINPYVAAEFIAASREAIAALK